MFHLKIRLSLTPPNKYSQNTAICDHFSHHTPAYSRTKHNRHSDTTTPNRGFGPYTSRPGEVKIYATYYKPPKTGHEFGYKTTKGKYPY